MTSPVHLVTTEVPKTMAERLAEVRDIARNMNDAALRTVLVELCEQVAAVSASSAATPVS
jgi:hypothetical protein